MKNEVYSWRLPSRLKGELEEAAREEERQRTLHQAARPFLGAIEGVDPHRAERARAEIRSRVAVPASSR